MTNRTTAGAPTEHAAIMQVALGPDTSDRFLLGTIRMGC
jgi:hypothetical protein